MALFELTLGWLADLVAQHLYKDDVPMPQRRRWSFDGNPFAFTDDSTAEAARFTLNPIKATVRGATTANITLSGLQTIDTTVVLIAGDRVLVRAQTTASQNGIYVVSSGAWTRAGDMNTSAKVHSHHLVAVQEGVLFGDTLHMLLTVEPISLGTSSLIYAAAPGKFNPNAETQQHGTVQTVNATPAVVTGTARTLSDNTAYRVTAWIVARGTAGVERALYGVTALVYRQAAGAATIQGTVQNLHTAVETTAGLDATITVNSNDARVTVTGLAATTINWKVKIEYQEVA